MPAAGDVAAAGAGLGHTEGVEGDELAVTLRAALIVTVQVPVPEQAPDQPAKREPEAAAAVRATTLPSS